jgi:hypothetical protein
MAKVAFFLIDCDRDLGDSLRSQDASIQSEESLTRFLLSLILAVGCVSLTKDPNTK